MRLPVGPINRSLQDFARTNPYFNVEVWDAASSRMTVAGRNNRYNTIQIDGAVNNDLFGLAATANYEHLQIAPRACAAHDRHRFQQGIYTFQALDASNKEQDWGVEIGQP